MAKVSKEQIKARYWAGTMGYYSSIRTLMQDHGMSESEADDFLLPPKAKAYAQVDREESKILGGDEE